MPTTFLIVLGILALFGIGDAGDACAITLLLKVLPFLIIVGIVASLAFCGGCFFNIKCRNLLTTASKIYTFEQ